MQLEVALDHFAEAALRHGARTAYISAQPTGHTLLTALGPNGLLITARTQSPLIEAQTLVEKGGLFVHPGQLRTAEPQAAGIENLFVVAISYRTERGRPGLWVDCRSDAPTEGSALDRFYNELRTDGEIGALTLDEFLDIAEPTVVILSPADIERFRTAP